MDILAAIEKYDMFAPGDRVVVAVSGGVDSVVLLHQLNALKEEIGISLVVAHLEHGIRGDESKGDQEYVQKLAQSLGLNFVTASVDVPKVARETGCGIEETARNERYKYLRQTMTEQGANRIATGHNADDRAETVLINIMRGSGLDGLSSIGAVSSEVVRPLIETTRAEVEEYATINNIGYVEDSTNIDTDYTRNRVRHVLLPEIERDYNPKVKQALGRLADLAQGACEITASYVDTAMRACALYGRLDAGLLRDLPRHLLYEVVRKEIGRAMGTFCDLEYAQVERVVEALVEGGDFKITLPSGEYYAVCTDGLFYVSARDVALQVADFDYALDVPGDTAIQEAGVLLVARQTREVEMPLKARKDQAFIDAGKLCGRLRARSLRPGDRMRPFGMQGTKKLQDIFVDAKISREDRAKAIVVCDDEKIVWVVGVVASEDVRVEAGTRDVIILEHADVKP